MARSPLSRVLRRAVLAHLSLAAPYLVGCGGQSGSTFPGVGPPDASPTPPCAVDRNLAPQYETGSCEAIEYPFNGTAMQCGGSDAGFFPASACQTLCPPIPADAGAAFGGMPSNCYVGECSGCGPGMGPYGQLSCLYACGTGRRPEGLRFYRPRTGGPVARFLAHMAYLEAASVPAFGRLARELRAHGAPEELTRAALRAARDEVRHARIATELAEQEGARVRRPRVRKAPVRPLVEIAIENAVEGCVNETFGAAIAMAQSMTAADASTRDLMRRIASDETRHAELAWKVAAWIDSRLHRRDRERVARSRRRAARALVRNASRAVHPEIVQRLGLPDARQARAMAIDLQAALWAPLHDG